MSRALLAACRLSGKGRLFARRVGLRLSAGGLLRTRFVRWLHLAALVAHHSLLCMLRLRMLRISQRRLLLVATAKTFRRPPRHSVHGSLLGLLPDMKFLGLAGVPRAADRRSQDGGAMPGFSLES
jgi:hypothetical protein